MPVFPSREWCEEVVRLVNADPESVEAGEGWVGDVGLVVEREAGKLERSFTIHCVPRDGKIHNLRLLEDPDELEEIEPRYLARAPYSVWKALIQQTLDPIEALVRRRISVDGDVQQLIERMRYKGIAERVLAKLNTRFVDER
jgi:putative sterol carrier protein